MSNNKKVIIYTDGACSGNPGPGGWGAYIIYGDNKKKISGANPETTNNQMELQATIEALKILKRPCQIDLYTDSSYVQKGITEWIYGWKKKNWKKKGGEIKNLQLWQELDQLNQKHQVNWQWVKGHAGIEGNEIADELARNALSLL